MIFTKTARNVTLFLTIAAEIICCVGLNLLGGFALVMNDYANCGYALIISTVLLIAALVVAGFKKVIIPLILNIAGSAFYIYTLAFLSAIPNTLIPKENTEKLMANHFPTIAVTVLLALLIFFNFMSEENVEKRNAKKAAALEKANRDLHDDEKIV